MAPIRVLLVDDAHDFAGVAASNLEGADERVSVDAVHSPASALDRIDNGDIDCVVTDYDMPEHDGLDFLEQIRADHGDLPVILFTGKGSESVASEAIAMGVTDYLQKGIGGDQYELLANRIANAVQERRATRRAAELDRVRRVLRDVNQALVRAESQDDLETHVCEIIADAEPYRFAWIGDHDPANRTVEPRSWAGIDAGYLETVEITTDDRPTGQGPTGRAIRERKLVVMQNILEDPDYEPWRDEAADRGYRASAAIPLECGGTLHGVLNVYADRTDAFDEREQELLAELGDDLAHAIDRLTARRRQRRMEQLVSAMNDGAVIARKGVIEYVNPSVEDLMGLDAEELVGRHMGEFIAPEYRETVQHRHESRLRGDDEQLPELYEIAIVDAEGREIPVEIHVSRIEYDGDVATLSLVRDVSERKEREAALEAAQRRFEAVFNNPVSFIALLEPDGTVIDINQTALEFVDCTTDEVTGKLFWETPWWTHSEQLQADLESWIEDAATGEPVRFEADHYSSDGEQVTVDAALHPIRDNDEAIVALLAAGRDISERKARERALEERNSRLEEFASIVSHDLRNPLNVATGRLTLARAECESEHLEDIRHAHDRMETLIDELLDLARTDDSPLDAEAVDLATVAHQAWRSVETADATLVAAVEIALSADRSRLQQLLENLIRNAVEHAGETVTVTVDAVDDEAGFFVADDGPGIPPKDRDRVFESGYSTASDGTGYGLTIVSDVVDAHDWAIRVDESADGGARFEIVGVEVVPEADN